MGNNLENTQSSTSDKVINYFLDCILNGSLQAGDKIPPERSITEEFEIGRSSVREAIKSMETMGLFTSIRGSGTYVRENQSGILDKAQCAQFMLSGGTLDDIMKMRAVLETTVCREIIHSISDDQISSLRNYAEYNYDASVKDQAIIDENFHMYLVSMSKNIILKTFYYTLSSLMNLYREKVLEITQEVNENSATRSEHLAICVAIAERNEEAAVNAILDHINITPFYKNLLFERYGLK